MPGAIISAPVTADTAANALQGWLRLDKHPLGAHLSGKIRKTDAVKDSNGNTLYYVAHLQPAGYVVLAGDDSMDPIIAFSATGSFNTSPDGIVAGLLKSSVPKRLAKARLQANPASTAKWRAFLAGSPNPPPDVVESNTIVTPSQVWVAPFIQTLWNQQTDVSETEACYNYFTPPYGDGNPTNDPCGCVATAMAQTMYYFRYPTGHLNTTPIFTYTNAGSPSTARLRGGDGNGGPYQWTNMPLSPDFPTTNQAIAIGGLTFDAGITVNMSYTSNNSTAATALVQTSLMANFNFGNASYFEDDNNGLAGTDLMNMINPNLDARLPLILGVQFNTDVAGGHCVLCDGYGYVSETLFYHLNAGWGGDNDLWFALPYFNAADQDAAYNTIFSCVYNIYTNGSGQIISGRVTDPNGAPLAGVTVSGGGGSATTDTNGIYALTQLTAGTTTVTASLTGYTAASNQYTTAPSVIYHPVSGDVWGANFTLSPPLLVSPESGFSAIGPSNGPFSVILTNYTITNTSQSPVSWVLSNSAPWLSVSSTNGTLAPGTVSTLAVSINTNMADRLAVGTHAGSIWFTNLSNNLAQQLNFSLTVAAGDYPIAVTGYNLDVVVESNAVGGNTTNYADIFDPSCSFLLTPGVPLCFYEAGLAVTNDLTGGYTNGTGLPAGGFFTSESDHLTTFQLGPYDSYNTLYLTASAPSNSLTLDTPASYRSLTVLAGSSQGGGSGSLTLHFSDGSSSQPIAFNAANYQSTNSPASGAAITNFGQMLFAFYTEFSVIDNSTYYPTLYQTPINLQSLGLSTNLIRSISFIMPDVTNAGMATGIFAVSGTQSVYSGNYSLTVTASPNSGGIVTGGGAFAANSVQTLTATATPGYVFRGWTENGTLLSTNTTFMVTLTGSMNLIANFAPVYTVTVSNSPAAGGAVTGGGDFAAGTEATLTATPNAGYEFVAWSGGVTGPSATTTFTVTTNLVAVANYAAVGAAPTLLVITNGDGKVSRPANATLNHTYSLTATPATGNIFAGWTGSLETNKNPFSFKFLSNTVLQANFISNPFIPAKGTYNGLFYLTNVGSPDVAEATAGMLKNLTIGAKGTYTGTLMVDGAAHSLSGTFSAAGTGSSLIKRPGSQGDLLVAMELSTGNVAPQIVGTVTGTNASGVWQAPLVADRATNVVPSAEWTMLIPPGSASDSPGGYGYASITNHNGNASISGRLSDGASFSQNVPVSADGFVPLYQNLYSGAGLLLGWINLDLTNTSRAGLTWIHPATRHGTYTNGFTNIFTAGPLLSPWTNSHAAIADLTNLLVGVANIPLTVSNNFKLGATSGTTPVSGAVNQKTGTFTVTIGKGNAVTNGFGAILQSPLQGGGYYIVTNTSLPIELNSN